MFSDITVFFYLRYSFYWSVLLLTYLSVHPAIAIQPL